MKKIALLIAFFFTAFTVNAQSKEKLPVKCYTYKCFHCGITVKCSYGDPREIKNKNLREYMAIPLMEDILKEKQKMRYAESTTCNGSRTHKHTFNLENTKEIGYFLIAMDSHGEISIEGVDY